MIHLYIVCQFVHHDHLNMSKRQPAAPVAFQHELYDLPIVEIATNEFTVRLVLFQGCNGEMMRFHDWVTYRSDTLEIVLGEWSIGTWQWLDKGNSRVRLLVASVDALDAHRHAAMEGRYWQRLNLEVLNISVIWRQTTESSSLLCQATRDFDMVASTHLQKLPTVNLKSRKKAREVV